jgi:circadian clock protein KaiC
MTDDILQGDRISTGVSTLDSYLGGGFVPGGVYLLTGDVGTGKTLLAHQTAFQSTLTGGTAVYVTVYTETHTRLFAHLRPFTFFNMDAVGEQLQYFNAYHIWRQGGYAGLQELIQPVLIRQRATLLIVDGLPLHHPGQDPAAMDDFLHHLQAYSEMVQCTALILTPPLRVDPSPLGVLLVDGVLTLSKQARAGSVERWISVTKWRGSIYEGSPLPFTISSGGLVVSGPETTDPLSY